MTISPNIFHQIDDKRSAFILRAFEFGIGRLYINHSSKKNPSLEASFPVALQKQFTVQVRQLFQPATRKHQ